jgi:hypothetical protein
MASLARANGVAITATATPENFQGKAPKFIAVVIKNVSGTAQNIGGEFGPEELVNSVYQIVTSGDSNYNYGANILYVQHDATGQLSFCLEGATSWTAALLQAAIRAAGTINSIDVSGTTATDVGFKLALS